MNQSKPGHIKNFWKKVNKTEKRRCNKCHAIAESKRRAKRKAQENA